MVYRGEWDLQGRRKGKRFNSMLSFSYLWIISLLNPYNLLILLDIDVRLVCSCARSFAQRAFITKATTYFFYFFFANKTNFRLKSSFLIIFWTIGILVFHSQFFIIDMGVMQHGPRIRFLLWTFFSVSYTEGRSSRCSSVAEFHLSTNALSLSVSAVKGVEFTYNNWAFSGLAAATPAETLVSLGGGANPCSVAESRSIKPWLGHLHVQQLFRTLLLFM